METWTLILLLLIFILTRSIKLLLTSKKQPPLPPGPNKFAFFLNNMVLKKKSLFELEQILLDLHSVHGPIMCLRGTAKPTVFIQGRGPTHRALVQRSAVVADRPPSREPMRYITCGNHDINSSSSSSPIWRLLRRHLTSEMLHPSRVKQFAPARRWAASLLTRRLKTANSGETIRESIQFAMFSLMAAMCFGEKIGEEEINEMREIQYSLLLLFTRFNYFAVFPRITKVVFRRKWEEIVRVRRRQTELFGRFIRARREGKGEFEYSYVHSLLSLEIEEEEKEGQGKRRLREDEMTNLCHEFMSGGTDTSSTALEWIMAELVKHQNIQERVAEEIERVLPDTTGEEIREAEDIQGMKYLKALVMEGLRRHPPGHFTLPHMATEDVELDGYLIPKGSEVHINIAQVGRDAEAWDDPMEFKPERFFEGGEKVDLTGSKEIKMMPFGVGRRICPGMGLAMLHMEYFLENLVREFEWKPVVEGETVDLAEMLEFTTVMKNPLRARVLPRRKQQVKYL